MRRITLLTLLLTTTASVACPNLIAYCQLDHFTRLGYITFESRYNGAAPECKATISHMDIIRQCKEAFPDTTVIIYPTGADFSLTTTNDALTTNALLNDGQSHWGTDGYQNEIDLSSTYTFGSHPSYTDVAGETNETA